ncbi:MAG: hypothetical protein RTU30_07130 [Candidatus Thorarchaeota archaeon]
MSHETFQEEFQQKKRRLENLLEGKELIDITGIVHSRGSVCRTGFDSLLVFFLTHWRLSDGEIQRKKLRVEMHILLERRETDLPLTRPDTSECREMMRKIKGYDIVRISARYAHDLEGHPGWETATWYEHYARMEKLLEAGVEDEELMRIVDEKK